MKAMSGLALTAVLRCAPAVPGPAPADRRRVVDAEWFPLASQWQQSPWWRGGNLPTEEQQVRVLISRDGAACRVSAQVWAVAPIGELWACADGWREPRRGS